MSAHTWKGRLYVDGKLCDVTLAVDINMEKLGRALALKATRNTRRTAELSYGAVHAEAIEVQQVL